jgi:carboxyl-terminal processing protease
MKLQKIIFAILVLVLNLLFARQVLSVNFPVGPRPDSSFFFNVWALVKAQYYYSQPFNSDSLSAIWSKTKEALKNYPEKNDSIIFAELDHLLSTLPDGHTNFFDPKATIEWQKMLEGHQDYGGIGAPIINDHGKIRIFDIFSNSPAEKNGLKRGDEILKIDNYPIDGLSLNEITKKIRGKIGSPVYLTIQRDDSTKTIKIIREKIVPPRIKWGKFEKNIYYVRLYDFHQGAFDLFREALDSLEVIGCKPITDSINNNQSVADSSRAIFILDLRGNSGGFTHEATSILSLWTDTITCFFVSKEGITGNRCVCPIKPLTNFKTIILVDHNTASAAEIVTAALDELGFAVVVGDTTYGKGCFQIVFQLPFNTSVKITSGIWLTPSGKCIDKMGIIPDFLVKFDLEKWFEGIDNQLEAAKNVAKIK